LPPLRPDTDKQQKDKEKEKSSEPNKEDTNRMDKATSSPETEHEGTQSGAYGAARNGLFNNSDDYQSTIEE
jgi:hypothetical protein